MNLKDRKKLTILIRRREQAAERLRLAFENDTDAGTVNAEIALDKVTDQLRKLIFPPVKTRYYEYDNA
jgi:hypothetical protein